MLHFLKTNSRILSVVVFLLAVQLETDAQTGPAGVGNSASNKVWLDASSLTTLTNESPVSLWNDRSGNSWNAYQNATAPRPRFLSNQLNGHPVIRFDRSAGGQWLDITSAGIGTVMSNSSTLFVVAKANSGGANSDKGQWQSLFGAIDSYSGILFQGFPTATHLYIDGWVGNPAANDLVVRPSIIQGEWYLATRVPKESAAGTTLTGYSNGLHSGSTASNLQLKNHNNLVRIGACFTSGTYQYLLNGDIAEIILFNVSLNDAHRIIVENYLSSKYGLSIGNDYYSNQGVDFIKDVQGIGTTDGLSKNTAAANGGGMLLTEISNSLNGLNEFLFSGHAIITNSIVTTDLPLGGQNRWQRSWYLEKTGSVDANLSFDFSQAGITLPSNIATNLSSYKLLYRSSSSGNFAVVKSGNEVLTSTLANGDQVVFAVPNAQLLNGYYTLGYMPGLVWTGAVNENWNEAGNWNLNRVPLPEDYVIINSCTTCPELNQSVSIGGLKMTTGSKLKLENYILTVAEASHVTGAEVTSESGVIQAADHDEIKSSTFVGSVTLEKTGGGNNSCYGGNTFSPELKVLNTSSSSFQLATQANNVVQ